MRTGATTGSLTWAWLVAVVSLVILVIAGGYVLGLRLGSLPDWIEAVGTVGTLTVAVWVLRVEQRNRITDDQERQARQVGGYITWAPDGSDDLVMTVTNASPLAVRDLRGYAFRVANTGAEPWEFPDIPVLPANQETQVRLPVSHADAWRLELEFDDDAGVRWRKYGAPPLQVVGRP